MNQIHTSYKTSERLKEFLGESAPEPINNDWWYHNDPESEIKIKHKCPCDDYFGREYGDLPAYQLHDLLSKPFCEAFTNACERVNGYCPVESNKDLSMELAYKNYFGGMEAVEKALTEMMEGI